MTGYGDSNPTDHFYYDADNLRNIRDLFLTGSAATLSGLSIVDEVKRRMYIPHFYSVGRSKINAIAEKKLTKIRIVSLNLGKMTRERIQNVKNYLTF